MKTTVKRPNITQYYFRFEPGDELHHACMWAVINLDHDTFTMTATSDCGDYSYAWCVTQSESFALLMARISGEYLLNKISRECVFDFEDSKKRAVEDARIDGLDDDVIRELERLDTCGEEMFFRQVEELTGWDFEYVPITKRHPQGAETFVRIFTEYLQPMLREGAK